MLTKRGEVQGRRGLLYYDAGCGLCLTIVRWLKRLDRLGSLEFRDTVDGPARRAGLEPADLARSAFLVIPDGRAFEGFYAFRRLVLRLPVLWPLAPLTWLPGGDLVGVRLYRWVAGRRADIFGCR